MGSWQAAGCCGDDREMYCVEETMPEQCLLSSTILVNFPVFVFSVFVCLFHCRLVAVVVECLLPFFLLYF